MKKCNSTTANNNVTAHNKVCLLYKISALCAAALETRPAAEWQTRVGAVHKRHEHGRRPGRQLKLGNWLSGQLVREVRGVNAV